uniref:Uncharacterized protein n=1 Tax=Coccidioides posadasii RMSCC 3488 TaxID=454284 RepID=A0A0J6FAW2_COCPO|nr:hypothetical protein CPAG_02734 [Coccidioides posadasii RMSCC 3488]
MSRPNLRKVKKITLRDPNPSNDASIAGEQQTQGQASGESIHQSIERESSAHLTPLQSGQLEDLASISDDDEFGFISTLDTGDGDAGPAYTDNDNQLHEILKDAAADAELSCLENEIPVEEDPEIDEDPGPMDTQATMPILEDESSEAIPHSRAKAYDQMDQFLMSLALWCEHTGISRQQYQSLREILQNLTDIKPLKLMPTGLSTLKKRCRSQFPILPIRQKALSVIPKKMPTLSDADKRLAQAALRTNMYFQDPIALISTLVKSPIFRKKLHIGMAELVDNPRELWQSWSWGSSIKYSSGEFAYYRNGEPIFPSDFVLYQCRNADCPCNKDPMNHDHLGRVQFVGRDKRSNPLAENAIALRIQPVYRFMPTFYGGKLSHLNPQHHPNEVLALESQGTFVLAGNILSRVDVYLDYGFNMENSGYELPNAQYFMRRVLTLKSGTLEARPLNMSTPLRGELEIAAYGREVLKQTFSDGKKVISLPYQLFIDGFGLYRNMYRSLMGFYMIPAGMKSTERAKRNNVYTITFGPHGTNFPDVIEALEPGLALLDKGIDVDIPSEGVTRVISSCLCFLGDMPQQNANAGIKGPTATRSCRSCMVSENQRHDMDFDTMTEGRYHFRILQQREKINSTETQALKQSLCKEYGMAEEQTALLKICPSLNLVTFFPSDPCHSEFSGISKLAHYLLVSVILTPHGQKEYCKLLQRFPFRRRWARLQSPLTHLESYQLQEHARASIIIPLLLRCYMTQEWINPAVQRMMPVTFKDHSGRSTKDLIVRVYAGIARSNSVLTSQSPAQFTSAGLREIITTARQDLQSLIDAAASAVETTHPAGTRAGSRAASITSARPSPVPIELPALDSYAKETGVPIAENFDSKKKTKAIRSFKNRPNMHVGIHYPAQANEYAIPNNCNVLIGEDKHREYKKLVQRTNKRDVEKVLLMQESFRRTLLLLLEEAFADSEPSLTQYISNLYEHCPTLFADLLRLNTDLHEDEFEAPDAEGKDIAGEYSPNLWAQQSAGKMVSVLGIPNARLSVLPNLHPFLQKLRYAYKEDWDKPSVVEPGSTAIRFYKNITFSLGDQRIKLMVDDLIEYTHGTSSAIGQITSIFIHELHTTQRVFFSVIPALEMMRDRVLDLPIVQVDLGGNNYTIIGLPAIEKPSLYAVPISEALDASGNLVFSGRDSGTFLLCTWDVSFL